MTARVLVVDDLFPNVKLLEAKLTAEYFDVLTSMNGPDALAICEQGLCDIVLLDVMMPGMDGFEVCRRLKTAPLTAHLPVVMVTALDQPRDRLKGLDAGADDFLTKPVDDVALLARVRSLVRLKVVIDELRTRAVASRDCGFGDPLAAAAAETGHNARILLVDDRPSSYERLSSALGPYHRVEIENDPHRALIRAAEDSFEVVLVSLDLRDFDGLRLCSQLRSLERTRNAAVLMMAEAHDRTRILRGLDIGVHDYLLRPVDRNELFARVRTQVRRKRFAEHLRDRPLPLRCHGEHDVVQERGWLRLGHVRTSPRGLMRPRSRLCAPPINLNNSRCLTLGWKTFSKTTFEARRTPEAR